MAKLSKCNTCNNKISKNAVVCPNCGQPQKKKSSGLIKLFLLLLVTPFAIAIFLPDSSNESKNIVRTEAKNQENISKSPMPTESARNDTVLLFQGEDEPTAKDALWTSDDIFKVGVIDDGSPRNGYADYVCQVLYDYGFKGHGVWVQVIDINKLTRDGDWIRLGEARCS